MNRKRWLIRVLVLFWLGWYLCGPIAETFDFWDPPREEMRDVERNAGGLMTLLAIVVCFGIAAFRKLRARCLSLGEILSIRFVVLIFYLPSLTFSAVRTLSHSPPLSLRI